MASLGMLANVVDADREETPRLRLPDQAVREWRLEDAREKGKDLDPKRGTTPLSASSPSPGYASSFGRIRLPSRHGVASRAAGEDVLSLPGLPTHRWAPR
jgi:hypothetical protein